MLDVRYMLFKQWMGFFILVKLFKSIYYYQKRFKKNIYLEKKRNLTNEQIRFTNQGKSVLICMHSFNWSGAEKFAMETIQYLYKNNIDFWVFVEKYSYNPKVFLPFLQEENIYYAKNYQSSASQLLEIISVLQPSILHIHHSYSAYMALPLMPRSIFVCDTVHIIEYQSGGYPYLAGKYSSYIQLHHVISNQLKEFMITELGVPAKKIRLGYLLNKSTSLIAKHKDFDLNHVTIGFLGRFERQKRPEVFIEFARYMTYFYPQLHIKYIMQGDGRLKVDCVDKISQYNLAHKIKIINPNENIDKFHESIDFLLNPAENEGLALTSIEAAKKRTICISADVGAQCEIVDKRCLVPAIPYNFIVSSAKLIIKLIQDVGLREEILCQQLKNWERLVKYSEKDIWKEIYE